MLYVYHHTQLQSTNALDILPGHWVPGPKELPGAEQYLIHYQTYFIIDIIRVIKDQVAATSVLNQKYFTKINCVCVGEEHEGFDTFFAAGEKEIYFFRYSENDGTFVAFGHLILDPLLIKPSHIYYKNQRLVISCDHGALGLYSLEGKTPELLIRKKEVGWVLTTFVTNNGDLARLEPNSVLTTYSMQTIEKKSVEDKYNRPESNLYYAFPFKDGVILCYQNRMCLYDSVSTGLVRVQQLDAFLQSPIVSACSFGMGAVVLSETSQMLHIKDTGEVKLLAPKQEIKRINRILSHGPEIVLAIGITTAYVIPERNVWTPKASFTCRRSLLPVSCNRFMPSFVTFSDKNVNIFQQGYKCIRPLELELDETPIGVYSTLIENMLYIFFAFHGKTSIYKFGYDSTGVPILENASAKFHWMQQLGGTTLGVGVFLSAQSHQLIFVHGRSNGFTIGNLNTSEIRSQKDEFVCFHASASHIAFVSVQPQTTKRVVAILESSAGGTIRKLEPDEANIKCIALSGSYMDLCNIEAVSQHLAVCAQREQQFYVTVYPLDTFGQETRSAKLSMPSAFSSICWFDQTNFACGFEDGSLVVCRFDKDKCMIHYIETLSLGEGPVRLFGSDEHGVIFAVCSRTWHISLSQLGSIRFYPVIAGPIGFIVLFKHSMISVTDRTVSFMKYQSRYAINESSQIKYDHPIREIRRMPLDPLVLAMTDNDIFVVDTRKVRQATREPICHAESGEKILDFAVNRVPPMRPGETNDSIFIFVLKSRANFDGTILQIIDSPAMKMNQVTIMPKIREIEISEKLNVISTIMMATRYMYIASNGTDIVAFKFNQKILKPVSRLNGVGKRITRIEIINMIGQGMPRQGQPRQGQGQARHSPRNYIIIGDAEGPVSVYRYDLFSHQFIRIRCDCPARNITTIFTHQFFYLQQHENSLIGQINERGPSGLDSSFVVGDKFGNMFKVDLNLFDETMRTSLSYNVGDVITGSSFVMGIHNILYYITAGSTFGAFMMIRGEKAQDAFMQKLQRRNQIMRAVEDIVAEDIYKKTGVNPYELRSRHAPASFVIDLDIIEALFSFGEQRQKEILGRLEELFKKSNANPAEASLQRLKIEFDQMMAYYINWVGPPK